MKIVVIAVFLCVAGLGVLAYKNHRLPFLSDPSGQPAAIRLTGVVAADETIVAAKIAGRIQRLTVEEGSWVEKDQVIVLLDREELAADRKDQEAKIKQLEARLRQTRATESLERERSESSLSRSNAQLQATQSQRSEALAELAQLQKDAERQKELMATGIVSKQERERLITQINVAEAKAKSLENQVNAARADVDVCRANLRQASVLALDVEQTTAQLEQARAQLVQASARLGYTELRAPRAGTVSLRVALEGEVVKPGDPIVTIVDLNNVWVRAQVEESYITRTALDETLTVQLASGEQIQGKVIAITPEGEFATQRDVSRVKRDIRTFAIKVQVPNPRRRVHPGMTAYVVLPENNTSPVLSPPAR